MKNKKKFLALTLAFTVLLGTLSSCAGDDNASSGGSPEDGTVYNLSFTIHDPAGSVKTQLYQEKADLVREATDGAVNITIYPSGTLLASTDVAEGVLAGTADMGWLFTPFFTNQFPLTEVVQMPLQFGDVYATSMTVKQMYEEYAEVQAELAGYKVLNIYTQPGNYLFTTNPIYTADDLNAGMTFITPTQEQLATFEVAANAYIDQWCETYTTPDFDARAFFERAKEVYESYLPDSATYQG